jgi:putative glutathione S-transferase
MGLLVDGVWHDRWYDTEKSGGRFLRQASAFRHWITRDGSSPFPAEPERYHLYVSLACPWAHRTLILRKLKRLEDVISVSVVDWFMGDQGWSFSEREGCTLDVICGAQYLHQIYTRAMPTYSGRVTVPVLWDKATQTLVNNESSEIIRMLNGAFDAWGDADVDLYPAPLRAEIDAINARIYNQINDGVYRTGFASTQAAYEAAYESLFALLEELEGRLDSSRYLCGGQITEADFRLFTTLVRFDAVYYGHFKCNRRRLIDYPNLWGYTRDLYQIPGVAETVNFRHIKGHYYQSHPTINPTRIVPVGPELDFTTPHGRASRSYRL